MKINILGNIYGSSGYASHTRQLANAMHQIGIDVRLDTQCQPGWELQTSDAELAMITKEKDEERTGIFIGLPPYWPLILADNYKHFIGFLVWEGKYIPKYWLKYMEDTRIDQIWVPSIHCRDAILNTIDSLSEEEAKEQLKKIIENKLKIIPHGVDLSLFRHFEKTDQMKDHFIFIANKGWAKGMKDRGGIQYLIKAYKEEFVNDEKVILRIKINPAYFVGNWNIDDELRKIGIAPAEKPLLQVNFENYRFDNIPKFYMGDCFISTTMCDGFNLPGLEAKAAGLPTIQTGWGGQTDYMSNEADIKLDYSFVNVTDWGDPMHEGNEWAMPNISDLKAKMRWAYEHQEELKKMGLKAKEDAQHWSWLHSAEKAKECLKKL